MSIESRSTVSIAPDLSHARQRITRWLCEDALPLWARQGVDRQAGGFFEQLDNDAEPMEEPRRTRVVARHVYVFATAARWGWMPSAQAEVDHGLRFLFERLHKADGTFAAAVRPDGTVVRGHFDLYEQAFALFAMAAAYVADPRRERLPEQALALLRTVRAGWAHPAAGFEESQPPSLPLKSNPHMHMLEAALAWSEAAPAASRAVWNELADELAELSLSRFIDPATGALREYFDASWQPMADESGRTIEPGHQFEWAWLMMRWGVLRSRPDALAAARRLVEIGEGHGVDPARNVAFNELRDDFQIIDPVAKLWPQTERIKAWVAMGDNAVDDVSRARADDRAVAAIEGLTQYFVPSPKGLWREQIDAQGRLLPGATRASSLYHIVCAIETLNLSPR